MEVNYYARCYIFDHLQRSIFNESLIYQLQDCITDILYELFGKDVFCIQIVSLTQIHLALERFPVFSSEARKVMKYILHCIYPAIDKFMRHDISEKDYVYYLSTYVRFRRIPYSLKTFEDAIYCWKAIMLESPVRGGKFFLNNDKSQDVFCSIWALNLDKKSLQYHKIFALRYLLQRIKPSRKFGEFIQEEVVPYLEEQISDAFELHHKPLELSEEEWLNGAEEIQNAIHTYVKTMDIESSDYQGPNKAVLKGKAKMLWLSLLILFFSFLCHCFTYISTCLATA
ncbi:hypothetical protein BDQ17DRAFT_629876 [Cyathus striatus]|nr:hypothetical protein BDQ17DRAFT_629876 [Cyathus striatus]